MEIRGATVLLTGANGGLGLAIGRALKAEGAELVVTGRREDALKPVADELGARMVLADLADREQVAALAERAGAIDVLVANAALPSSGELLEYSPEQVDRALDVNLRAPIMLARQLAPAMVAAGRGHLVMVGSISGKTATAASSLYNATKYGLRGFTLGFRQDLHGTGVGVSLIQPGFVRDAGMFHDTGAKTPGGARTSTPRQVARGVLSAIRRNRAEVNIAPFEIRALSAIGGQFPGFSERVQRLVVRPGDPDMKRFLDAQKTKR
ncbi:SDR family NAD(P)-dependent oxidoreductase [Actinocorallia longicatena]|uniref:SDR family NAD(P)-dependent oxidoreductase n=1 Tax=Actinocorallia longicatena TaxID=111803 RepID=A0ABP6PXN4_9ACTN